MKKFEKNLKFPYLSRNVISEFTRLEKAIGQVIKKYLHISASVYFSWNAEHSAAWFTMSQDNSYIRNYASELADTVCCSDYDEETGEEKFINDPLTFQRLVKLENKLENLFDAREKLLDKYGNELYAAACRKKAPNK